MTGFNSKRAMANDKDALFEKFEVEQPAQEPLAWMCHPFGDDEVEYGPHQECENCVPLYTHPPQRTEQEPVAYLCENAVGHKYFRWKKPSSTYKPVALYTTPQPCPTCEALARAVMMDQTGRDI